MFANLRRTLAIAGKELRQLRRDRLSFGMIVGIPLLQITLFGYAINMDVRQAGFVDYANTQRARELIADAAATQVIDITKHAASTAELEALLQQGKIAVGCIFHRISSGASKSALGPWRSF
jgi:ABC-2 type transport system permease protein